MWLEKVVKSSDEFKSIQAFIIADGFTNNFNIKTIKEKGISTKYHEQIKLYSLKNKKFHNLSSNTSKSQTKLV